MDIVFSVLIGLVAGVLGGMFGIGGGLVMVPLLVILLGFSQHKAQGTSLAVLIIPVAILAVINYFKAGNIDVRVAGLIAAGFVGGGYVGSKISLSLDENTMRKSFAVFLVLVAGYMWWKASQPASPPASPPSVEAAS